MPNQLFIVDDGVRHRLHQVMDLTIGQDVAIDQLGQVAQIFRKDEQI